MVRVGGEEYAVTPAILATDIPMFQLTEVFRRIPTVVFLAALGLLCYFNALDAPFLFDDIKGIVHNPGIRQLWPPTAVMEVGADETPWGRPVVAYSLALNYTLSELDVASYHVVNLLIHIGSASVLFLLLRLGYRQQGVPAQLQAAARPLAFCIAALWLVHPLATNVVTYTVQRAESWMVLFYLLTLYGTARSTQIDAARFSVLAIICCALGMSSKESMVTAPIAAVLLEWVILRRDWPTILRQRKGHYLGLAATWGVLATWMYLWPRYGSVGGSAISAWDYFLMQWQIILHYAHLTLWPMSLSLDYDWPPVTFAQAGPYGLVLSLAASVGVYRLVRRRSRSAYLLVLIFLVLGPTSSVIPIFTSVAAEHRFLLPAACVLCLLVTGLFLLCKRRDGKNAELGFYGSMLALCLFWCFVTIQRNEDFRSPVAMWRDVTHQQPWNSRAWNNLGGNQYQAGNMLDAEKSLRRAIQLDPTRDSAYSNLAAIVGNRGEYGECIGLLQQALTINPQHLSARFNLAMFSELSGQTSVAIENYYKTLELNPRYASAHFRLALLLEQKNLIREALQHMGQALCAAPRDPDVITEHRRLTARLNQ